MHIRTWIFLTLVTSSATGCEAPTPGGNPKPMKEAAGIKSPILPGGADARFDKGEATVTQAMPFDGGIDRRAPDMRDVDLGTIARPDTGGDQRAAAVLDAAAPTDAIDLFDPVHGTFATFCADCHHGDYSNGPARTYSHLMGMTAMGSLCDPPPRPRVKRGDPENSIVFQKISRDTPSCGNRMPNTCKVEQGNCLSPKQIEAVRVWIAAGAPPPRK